MLSAGEWTPNQANRILFVMADSSGLELAGLGNTFTLQLSKNGAAFAGSAGTKAEIGNGWYSYLSTVAEANTLGPIAIIVSGAGAVQQNLEYVVATRVSGAIAFTYTLTNSVTLLPIEGAIVTFATDNLIQNIVWVGVTDAFGVARSDGNLPYLSPGTYYIRSIKSGFTFAIDTEVVS
jgi:hypothetical protein